ncbi:MAG: polysaccharide deacetylase family protein [Oscillospiraceae bacterium]|nr:polysaccharide deacetylase family protein [Oscillospiraceae bacterium]
MYKYINLKKLIRPAICIVILTVCCIFVYRTAVGVPISSTKIGKGIFLPVIMYHSILENPSRFGPYVVSPQTVDNDFAYLKTHGYETVLVADLLEYINNDVPLPEKPVMVTFDDGFYNNFVYVLPLLEKYDYEAVISVVGDYSQQYSEPNADLSAAYSYLTWEHITELAESGRVEIGNHTYGMHSHDTRDGASRNPGETLKEYEQALTEDIGKLQSSLKENAGVSSVIFTYPFGTVSRESTDILKEIGFKATFNCYEKPNRITKDEDCLFGLNRYNRPYSVSTEDFMNKLSIGNTPADSG